MADLVSRLLDSSSGGGLPQGVELGRGELDLELGPDFSPPRLDRFEILPSLPPQPHLAPVRAHHDVALHDALVRIPIHRLRQGGHEELPLDLDGHRSAAVISPAGRMGSETTRPPSGCTRSEEHTSELQSHVNLVCRLLLEK